MGHDLLLAAAYSAGIVVVFSPCATALLPAYLSFYLSRDETSTAPQAQLPRGVTAGVVGLVAGLALLAAALVDYVVSFGDRASTDAALSLSGVLALAVGAVGAWQGSRRMSSEERSVIPSQLRRGLVVGGTASLGIAATYGAFGVAVHVGLRGFPEWLPRIAFASAAVLVVLGVLMVLGRSLASFIPALRAPSGRGLSAFFLFGAGYGLIASGCFLPVFLQVVSASLTLPALEAAQVFASYALGSATVFLLITLSASLAHGATLRPLRAWRPYVHRAAGAIVVATGVYVLWYDWTFLLSQGL